MEDCSSQTNSSGSGRRTGSGITVTTLQILSTPCDRPANLERSAAHIRAFKETPDIVVLPELSSTGYSDEVLKNKENCDNSESGK